MHIIKKQLSFLGMCNLAILSPAATEVEVGDRCCDGVNIYTAEASEIKINLQ